MTRATEILQQVIAARGSIGLDTNCIQYFFEGKQPYKDILIPIFEAGLKKRITLHASSAAACELMAHLDLEMGISPNSALSTIFNIYFVLHDIDVTIAMQAAEAKTKHLKKNSRKEKDNEPIETADWLIAATSWIKRNTLFISNDIHLIDALWYPNKMLFKDLVLDWLDSEFPHKYYLCKKATPLRPLISVFPKGLSELIHDSDLVEIKPSITWRDFLSASFQIAAALNQTCAFIVFFNAHSGIHQNAKVSLWQKGTSSVNDLFRIATKHLEYQPIKVQFDPTHRPKEGRRILVFIHSSKARHLNYQKRTQFNNRSDLKKRSLAWQDYLYPFLSLKEIIGLPQVRLWICEAGKSFELDPQRVCTFLDKAKNVLGWKE